MKIIILLLTILLTFNCNKKDICKEEIVIGDHYQNQCKNSLSIALALSYMYNTTSSTLFTLALIPCLMVIEKENECTRDLKNVPIP